MIGGRRRAVALITALAGAAALGAALTYALDGGTSSTRAITTTTSATNAASVASTQPSLRELYRRSAQGVVEIAVSGAAGADQGSGFVLDTAGHIVTNAHVVGDGGQISVRFHDGTVADATLVGSDTSTDIAVLKVDVPAATLRPVALGDASTLQPGDPVIAIDSPFGLDGSITTGIVSTVDRTIVSTDGTPIPGAIQTDAAINHGNSGGPLLDTAGRVIGINSQIKSDSGGSDGIGFAVPIGTVRSVVAQLLQGGTAARAFLGVRLETVTPAAATELDLPVGVQLREVETDTPASRAGLRAGSATRTVDGQDLSTDGDVIVSVDGKRVRTAEHLQALIAAKKPGDRVTLGVVRKGKERTIAVTLGTRPS